MLTIRPEKTRPLPFLFNEMKRRHLKNDFPHYGFFLGDQVSLSSGFPDSSQLLEILRQLSFVKQHRNGHTIITECDFRQVNYYPFDQVTHLLNAFTLQYHSEYVVYCEDIDQRAVAKLNEGELLSVIRRLSSEIKEEYSIDFLKSRVTDAQKHVLLLRGWFYEFSENERERRNFVNWIVNSFEPSGALLVFAHLMNDGLIHHVFTKGYDTFLEDALFLFSSEKPLVLSETDISTTFPLFSSQPVISRLHGDFHFSGLKDLDYGNHLSSATKARLHTLLSEYGLVVVGYSGLDHTVMSELRRLKESEHNNYPLFWCSIEGQELAPEVVDIINNTQNTFYVPLPSFDHLMHLMWRQFTSRFSTQSSTYKKREARLLSQLESWSDTIKAPTHRTEFVEKVNAAKLYSQAANTLDPLEKITLLGSAIELNREDPILYVHRALSYIELGQVMYASEDFEKAIYYSPSEPSIFFERAKFFIQLEKLDNAKDDIDTAISLNASVPDYYIVRAEVFLLQQKYSSSVNDYDHAIRLRPNCDAYYRLRGYAFHCSGHHDKSLSDFNTAVQLNENSSSNYDFRADYFCTRQQYDLALADYSRAIALSPSNSQLFNNRANCYKLMGDFDRALADIGKSLELDADNVFALSTKAEVLGLKGNVDGFYHNLEVALKNGFPIWEHLQDDAYTNVKDEKRFKRLINRFAEEKQ
jgi:tetratricopeptide (TPR) repeat protein